MRQILQELYDKINGSDIFIVGGGSSLHDFDFDRLKNKNVIAINAAYKVVHDNAILFWADTSFGNNHEHDLLKHPSSYKFTSRINVNVNTHPYKHGIANSTLLKKSGNYGYDPNIDNVKGNNSGTQALNFAINLCPSRIFLLGFDMKYIKSKSHFHTSYDTSPSSSIYPELFIPSMNKLADEITHLKMDIINCSPDTDLTCFTKGNIEDFL